MRRFEPIRLARRLYSCHAREGVTEMRSDFTELERAFDF